MRAVPPPIASTGAVATGVGPGRVAAGPAVPARVRPGGAASRCARALTGPGGRDGERHEGVRGPLRGPRAAGGRPGLGRGRAASPFPARGGAPATGYSRFPRYGFPRRVRPGRRAGSGEYHNGNAGIRSAISPGAAEEDRAGCGRGARRRVGGTPAAPPVAPIPPRTRRGGRRGPGPPGRSWRARGEAVTIRRANSVTVCVILPVSRAGITLDRRQNGYWPKFVNARR